MKRMEFSFCTNRCAGYHSSSFLVRWVSLKGSQFIYLKIPQINNSFNSNDTSSGWQFDSIIGDVMSLVVSQ
jgi:hypothetical protein